MIDGLVRAWAAWERHPASRDAAVALEVELGVVAAASGMTSTALLVAMTNGRRPFAGEQVTNAELRRCVDVALGRLQVAA